MAASLGFRLTVFVIMTLSYLLFLIALAEKFALLPSDATSARSTKSSSPSSSQETQQISSVEIPPYSAPSSSAEGIINQALPFAQSHEDEEFFISTRDIHSSSSPSLSSTSIGSDMGIEICTDSSSEDCYIFYPGITPKRSITTPGSLVKKSGHVIWNVSTWVWGVLSRGVRPRGRIASAATAASSRRRSSLLARGGK